MLDVTHRIHGNLIRSQEIKKKRYASIQHGLYLLHRFFIEILESFSTRTASSLFPRVFKKERVIVGLLSKSRPVFSDDFSLDQGSVIDLPTCP